MRPTITVGRARALALTGTLLIAMPLAVSPATAQSDSTGTQDQTTPTTTTTTTPAEAPAPTAVAASVKPKRARATLRLGHARRDVVAGSRASVHGHLQPAKAGRTVILQVRRGRSWTTVDRTHTSRSGAFSTAYRTHATGSMAMRLVFKGDATATAARRMVGHLNVYRRAMASWYSDYGGPLACGGTLGYNTQGVANKTLPCGTKVTLRYHGRTVRVPVIDRGPYIAGREYDLTGATKRSLGFGDTGMVLTTR
jgi:rare lipoprotein A (peptidoglycan hydrolase)